MLALGLCLYTSWRYAARTRLLRTDLPDGFSRAIEHRILIAQAIYAFGASQSIISGYFSVAFIIIVQLTYAFAPGEFRSGRWSERIPPDTEGHSN